MRRTALAAAIVAVALVVAASAASKRKKRDRGDDGTTVYCNIEGYLCRDYPGRDFVNYVLDGKGRLIPCEFKEDECDERK